MISSHLSPIWAALKAQAACLGVLVFAKALSVKALEENLRELMNKATALQNLSESDEGLTPEQEAEWTALMAEDTGDVAKCQVQLAAAKRLENEQKRLAALNLQSQAGGGNPFARTGGTIDDGGQNPPVRNARRRFASAGRLICFRGEEGAENAYDAGMWLLAAGGQMTGRRDPQAEAYAEKLGMGFQMSHSEGEPGKGGYLAPEVLQTAFIERRERVGVLRQIAKIDAMTSEKQVTPKLLTGPAVVYPGELGTPSVSDQTWGGVHLSAVKRMVYGKFSRELTRDAIINVVDQFVDRMAYEHAKDEDRTGIKGDGTGAYAREVGLLNAMGAASKQGAAAGHNTWKTLDLADFTDTMGLLPDDYGSEGSAVGWLCSRAFYTIAMLRVAATLGGNNMQTIEVNGWQRPAFLGHPVYFTGQMPRTTAASTLCACFGEFAEGITIGDRQGLEVEMSDDAHFAEDVTAVKGTTRVDVNCHDVGDASNAGAVVGLVTAA